MPRVPRYQRQAQERISPNARVDASLSRGSFGIGETAKVVEQNTNTAAKVQRFAEAQQRIYAEEKGKQDEVQVLDAANRLRKIKVDLQYNKESGALRARGRSAVDAADMARKTLAQERQMIEQELGNDDQKLAFKKIASNESLDMDRTLQRHTMKEIEAHDEEVTNAFVATEMSTAIENIDSPERVQASIENIENAVTRHALRTGKSKEWIQLKVAESKSATHYAVASRMLSQGNDLTAKQYFKENKKELTGKHLVQLEGALEEGSLRGEAQRTIDHLWEKNGGDIERVLADSRSIRDPKLRDEVARRARQRFSDAKLEKQISERQQYRLAFDSVERDPRIEAIDPVTWASFSQSKKNNIASYVEMRRQGKQPETNPKVRDKLQHMSYTDPIKFQNLDLYEYKANLSPEDFKEYAQLKEDLRTNAAKARVKLKSFRTTNQIVKDTMSDFGITNEDEQRSFKTQLEQEYAAFQEVNKREPDFNELQTMADRLATEVEVKGGGLFGIFDKDKRVFELIEEGDTSSLEVVLDVIPPREKQRIREHIKAEGGVPTDAAIAAVYRAGIESTLNPGMPPKKGSTR